MTGEPDKRDGWSNGGLEPGWLAEELRAAERDWQALLEYWNITKQPAPPHPDQGERT